MYAFQSSIKSKKKGEKKRSAGGSRRESRSKEKNVTASSSDASSSSSSHPIVQPIVGLHTLPPYDNSTPSSIRSPSSASSRSPCSSPGSRSPSFSSSSPRLPLSTFALSAAASASELAHHAEEGDSVNNTNTSSQLLSLSSYSSTSASPYSSGPPSPLSSSSRSSSCSSLSTEEVFFTPPNEHSTSGATALTAKQAAKEEKKRLKEESTKQAAKEERRRLKQETLQRQKEEKRQHRLEADKQKELRREEKRILQMQKEQALEYRKEEKKHQKAERELLRQTLKEHKKESGSHHKTASMENILASSYPEGTQMEHMSKKWKKDQKKELALLKSLQKKEKKEGRWQNSLDSGSGSPLLSERSGEGGGSGRPSIGAMPKEDPSKSAATGSNKDLVTMLATFLCRAIINRFLRDPTPLTNFETSQFTSTILFIDISGFTAMTEKLTAYGQDKGSEQVVRHLNSYFSSLVQMVQLYGGDVITFAGDAVICMFGDAKEENNDYQHRLRSSCLHATACALRIQQDLPNHTMGDVCLTLHIGLATGHVHSMHVGGVKGSWKYLVAGEPFVHLGSVVEDSKTGEVVMCKRSRQLVSELVVGEARGELGNFLVKDLVVPDLLRLVDEANKPVSSASTSVSTTSFSSLGVGDKKNENEHEEKKEETADHKSTTEVQDTQQTNEGTIDGGAGVGEQGQNTHQALRRIMKEIHSIEPFTDIPESMEQNIWRYINDAVKTKVKAHGVEGFVWLNELRTVTILFMKFSSLMYDVKTNSINTEMVQNVLCIIQDIVYKFEGILCQMLTDDKGTILIATFGAVATHEDNPIRAVEAGLQIHNRLKINERIENSIGITTGKVFCGMVGSTVRREYTLIGDTVNLAARLMCAAEKGGNGLLCDGNTFKASKFGSRIQFVELPPVKVKGKDTMIAIFKPRALRKQSVVEGMWKGSKSDSSFSVTRQLLSSMATAEMMRSVPSSSPSSNSLAVPVSPPSSSVSSASSAASMMKPTSGATAAYTYSRPVENTMATMQSNRMLAKNVSVVRMVGGNMVGRDKEQALLKGALMRLNQSGQGGVVVVQGAAGMGKSILLNYLMDMCELHGTEYFVAATDSVERNTPFLVWSGIFHVMLQCYTYKDKEQRTRFLSDRYEQIEAIFSPEKRMTPFFSLLNPMLNVDFPELEQVAMHKKDRKWNTEVIHELLWWFIAIQTQNFSKPLIIVLDDCQWMDRASLAFTLHFAKELEVVDNLMLVLALRPLTNETHLLRLITIKNAIRIDLEALNDDHIFKIIEQRYNKLLRMESKRKAEEAHLKKRFEEEERKQQQQQGEPLEDKTKNRNNKSKKRQNKDETSGTSSAGTGQEFSLSSARVRMEKNESDDLEEEVEQEIDDTNNKEEASSDSKAGVKEDALTITKQQAQPTITTTEAKANEEQKTPISTSATVTTKTTATFKEPPTASEKKRSASHRLRRAQTVHASMEGKNASANSTNAVPQEQLRPSLGSSIEPRRSSIASSSSSSIPPPPPPPPAPLISNSNNSKKKKKNKSVRNHKPVSTVDKDKKQQQSSPLSSVRAASPPLSPSLDMARKTGIKGAVIFKNEENSNNDSTNNNPTTSPTSKLLSSSTNSPATSASGKQRTSQFAAGSKAHKQSLPNVHSPQDNPTQLPSPSLIPRQQQEQPQRKSSLLPSSTTTRASSSSSQHPAPPPPPSPPPLPSASSSTTSNDNNFAKLLQLGKRALRKRSTATSTASASSTIASHSAIDKAQRKREKQEQKMKEKETKREKKLLEQEAKKESQAKRKRSNSSYTKRIKTSSGSEKDENEEEIDHEERLARRNRRISPPSSLHRSTLSASHSDNSNLQEKFNSLNKPRERFKVNLFSSGIINSEEARLARHNPIVEDIIKKSQGNPFFAEELTTAMLDKLRKETRRSSKDPSTNNNREETSSLSSRSTSSSSNNNKATTLSSLTASGPLKQVKLKHKKKQQQQLPKDDSFIDRASSLRSSALPVKHSADALLRSGEGGGAGDDRQARRRSWNNEVALHPSLQEVQQQTKKGRSGSNPSVTSRDQEEGGTTKPKVKKGASYIEPSSHEAGEENLLSPRRKERSLTMMSKKEMKTLEKQEKKEQKKKDKEKKRTLLASQQQLQQLQLLQRPSLASNNSNNNSTNKNILDSIKGIAPVGEEELEELLRLEEENEASDDKNQDREDAEERNDRQKNLKSSLDLPEGIQDLMVARIDKLTPSLQLIVKIASVIGHEFELNTLLEIFPLKESRMAMRHSLTLLEKLDIISKKPCPAYREEGGKSDDNELYQFVHLIFFEVCYNVMTFAQRTRIHHKLAVYYEEKFKEDTAPAATLLAHHWCKVAEDLDTSAEVVIKAASYLSIAGMQALFLRQKKEALSFVAKGIKLMQAHRHFLTPGSEYENTYKELKSFLRLVNQ